jgi:hypothetical protein
MIVLNSASQSLARHFQVERLHRVPPSLRTSLVEVNSGLD